MYTLRMSSGSDTVTVDWENKQIRYEADFLTPEADVPDVDVDEFETEVARMVLSGYATPATANGGAA